MIKLYKNIIVFLFPILVLVIMLPVNKRSKYLGLNDDCFNHGIWIHDRIFENTKPIDIAVLGSSHTINGINDKLIESELQDFNASVVNLGYCRLGRNLSYTLIDEILKEKQPRYIIIEVREDEDRYSHPIFPYISNSRDVIFPAPLYNRDIFDDIFIHLLYKVELTQDVIFQKMPVVPINYDNFGFSTSPDTASLNLLGNSKQKFSNGKDELNKTARDFYMKIPRTYLKKIHNLCVRNKVNLLFVYIPSYGRYLKKPKEYNTYVQYGEVLIPPQEIMDSQLNWYDENHLNQAGANELSKWLASEIETKLEK